MIGIMLGTDVASPGIMTRKPRPSTQPIIVCSMMVWLALAGLFMAGGALVLVSRKCRHQCNQSDREQENGQHLEGVHIMSNEGIRPRPYLKLLLPAIGAPLIQMGDEVRRTQRGNNNVYCQDNELSWFDLTLLDKHADIHRFVKQLIADRLRIGRGRTKDDILDELLQQVKIEFHGVTLGEPDTSNTSHTLAMSRLSASGKDIFHVMVNADWEPLDFALPAAPANSPGWRLWIDTSRPSPNDINIRMEMPSVAGDRFRVGPRSVVALVATFPKEGEPA